MTTNSRRLSWLCGCLLLATGLCHAQSIAEQQDARAIENLVAAGSDITKEHDIDFFMQLPDKARAESAAKDLQSLGYTVMSIDERRDPTDWEIHAVRRMAPLLKTMTATTRSLEAIAARYGGNYDGWGTSVVE
ncbi:ribonuclease E inhibitor RraB [Stenotrophomonas sp. SY1]|nr:ribonuclease E inhibitor RraB [Stenotrophomonas sp. SY1]